MKSTSMEVPSFIQGMKAPGRCVVVSDPGWFLLILETLAPEFLLNQSALIAFCTPNLSS